MNILHGNYGEKVVNANTRNYEKIKNILPYS